MVVQDALVDALKDGTIFSAGLDVMTPEPLPADDILTKLPNCGECSLLVLLLFCFLSVFSFVFNIIAWAVPVLIPHLGSATHKTRDDMAILAAQNVINGLEGKSPIHSAY